jgi:hypothetical protein
MPRGDGTGPPGENAGGSGRMRGNLAGAGPGGVCKCPACGKEVRHQVGVPCYKLSCPNCGAKMTRG